MTEPTADATTDTGSHTDSDTGSDDTAAAAAAPAETAPDGGAGGADTGTPAPTIIILTEEALKPGDVDKIVALHEDEAPTYRVLVPADTERNLLSTFLNHLSLFEMREAIDTLRPVDREEARVDADTALSTTLSELASHEATATGEITADDPVPTLVEEVARLDATEVVIVTEPHAVEDTFHTDWASRAREVLGVPVLHMYAGDWRLG